jgi:hypothetical protein
MFIHGRTRNCILNLFMRIYYHDFILADDCIASKVKYFGGINQKCRFSDEFFLRSKLRDSSTFIEAHILLVLGKTEMNREYY